MTRNTSIVVYNKIKSEGLLSKRRLEIYDIMYHNGPMTSSQAFEIINRNRKVSGISQSRARFTELRDMGVLEEMGTTECPITKNTVILWDVSGQLPTELVKGKTKKQKKAELIEKINQLGFRDDMTEESKALLRSIYFMVKNI